MPVVVGVRIVASGGDETSAHAAHEVGADRGIEYVHHVQLGGIVALLGHDSTLGLRVLSCHGPCQRPGPASFLTSRCGPARASFLGNVRADLPGLVAPTRRTIPSRAGVGPRLVGMTEYQVTRWRELPSMVSARDGDETVKVQLAPRFQEAIDEAAMRLGDSGADDYLAGWERSAWTEADGTPSCLLYTSDAADE